jgi:manganese transport protein
LKTPTRLSSVILWSVISAAFIGPGTVTTAVSAGSQFGLDLLWAVTFATIGCIVLQEVSARITIASGLTFGAAMVASLGERNGRAAQWAIGLSVMLGCAAYEAGNILGAVSGLNLITDWPPWLLTTAVTAVSAVILWANRSKGISTLMTLLVLIMGIAFAALAISQVLDPVVLVWSAVVPVIPSGSELLVLGLVGTTIVPYNIFLGSGISKGQTIPLMRIGVAISVAIGGLVTAFILLAGNSIGSFNSFQELAAAMNSKVGGWGALALAMGLFAAGFSSTITSPYAASIVTSTVLGDERKARIRATWMAVLLTGFAFGVSGVKPIPVILAVQAINGLILPLLAAYLILVVNDERIVTKSHIPGLLYNVVLLVILFTVLLIGLNNVDKSMIAWFSLEGSHLVGGIAISAIVCVAVAWKVYMMRRVGR